MKKSKKEIVKKDTIKKITGHKSPKTTMDIYKQYIEFASEGEKYGRKNKFMAVHTIPHTSKQLKAFKKAGFTPRPKSIRAYGDTRQEAYNQLEVKVTRHKMFNTRIGRIRLKVARWLMKLSRKVGGGFIW